MFIASVRSLCAPSLAIALILCICCVALNVGPAAANEVIVLRSGNATVGNPDPFINMTVGSGGVPLSPVPFTPGDFTLACEGTSAIVAQAYPVWLQQLTCDPEAQWIGTDGSATPASTLFCYPFEIQTPCIESANLSFCWAVDDVLGDSLAGGANPDGVYLNGVAVSPSIYGGAYTPETVAPLTDVTSLVSPGTNYLEVYVRDMGFVVSGVIFSATIEITEGPTPNEPSTWGSIKALFQ
jgi:hypothetical protein